MSKLNENSITRNDATAALNFPSSDTVTLETASTERLRVDSSGRLLVGTSTLIDSSTASNFQIANASGPRLSIGRNDTSVTDGNLMGAIDFYGNDSNGTYQQCARILAEADGTHDTGDKPTRLALYTTADGASSGTERMRIDSSGKVGIGTNSPNVPLDVNGAATFAGVISADAGIDFSAAGPNATQNGMATTTTELLDHYEEGTWTPVLVNGNTTYTGQSGDYTRVGRLITIRCYLHIDTIGTGVDNRVGGIPFWSAGSSPKGCGSLNKVSDLAVSIGGLTCHVRQNTGDVYFTTWAASGGYGHNASDASIFQDDTHVQFSVTYFVP